MQYKSALSKQETLAGGVPQGTKFGPVTFIGMIESADDDAKTLTFKYIDDLSLGEVRSAKQPSQIEKDVQDLDVWADGHFLKFNPTKCKVMQACFMKNPPPTPQFLISLATSLGW